MYHVINRSNSRVKIFADEKEYRLFETVLVEAKERVEMRILGYCIMPNHWHLVLYPKSDGDLTKFMTWLTMTHTQRQHAMKKTAGYGHLYQGRYKSFPVETNEYLLHVLGYVERNPVRAKLVKRAEDWRWSSLWRRVSGSVDQKKLLAEWPTEAPKEYLEWINRKDDEENLLVMRESIKKNKPFGTEKWTRIFVEKFGLGPTLRGQGRPKKGS